MNNTYSPRQFLKRAWEAYSMAGRRTRWLGGVLDGWGAYSMAGGVLDGGEACSMAGRRARWRGGVLDGGEACSMAGRRARWRGGVLDGWGAYSMAEGRTQCLDTKSVNNSLLGRVSGECPPTLLTSTLVTRVGSFYHVRFLSMVFTGKNRPGKNR